MIKPADLAEAFKLPPRQAIAFLKQKGYAISWDWWDTWQQANAYAFTVAKVMQQDILEDIKAALLLALAEGRTVKQFQDELEPTLKKKGWWGKQEVKAPDGRIQKVQLGAPWRLKTIYRTNLQTAYMQGRYKQFEANAAFRPFWQYVAVMDSRTRPDHAAMHGKVFRYDDPIWNHMLPPLGFNCRCRVRALTAQQVERKGLKVETAQLVTEEQRVGIDRQTGEIIYKPNTGIITTAPDGNAVKLFPDAGWSYDKRQPRQGLQ